MLTNEETDANLKELQSQHQVISNENQTKSYDDSLYDGDEDECKFLIKSFHYSFYLDIILIS